MEKKRSGQRQGRGQEEDACGIWQNPSKALESKTRMKQRKLGSLDFQVSPVSFGGAGISSEGRGYSFGYISEKDAIALLRKAYDQGINLFDTAPIYGHGVSETRIGKAFRNIREKVFIVSKSGVTWDESGQITRTNDPAVAQRMLEQSLRDLKT